MRTARRTAAALAALALVGAEAGAVVVLVRLGRVAGFAPPTHDLGAWLQSSSTETVVAVGARLFALALTTWLLLATVLSLARRLLPFGGAGPALDFATPPSLRRLLDRVVLAGLGASLAIGAVRPAGAITPTSRVGGTRAAGVVTTQVDVPVPRVPPPPTATATPDPRPQPALQPPARADPPGTVEVRPGDNLWLIARRALGTDRPSAIAPYWRALIAANVATLRSHDPNLIFPGERLVLPPVEPRG